MTALNDLVNTAKSLLAAADAVAHAESALEHAKAFHRALETDVLPEMMRELGVTQFKLESGEEIALQDDVNAGVPEALRGAAADWLMSHGYGGIVKTSLSMEFAAGEIEAAQIAAQRLAEATGGVANVDRKIHPATLKSFVKERLAAGETLPSDIFSIHPFSRVKVAKARKTKI